jgi:hypothetical protein
MSRKNEDSPELRAILERHAHTAATSAPFQQVLVQVRQIESELRDSNKALAATKAEIAELKPIALAAQRDKATREVSGALVTLGVEPKSAKTVATVLVINRENDGTDRPLDLDDLNAAIQEFELSTDYTAPDAQIGETR